MEYLYVLNATTENSMRVLQRIASIFSRHRINIEKLNVNEIGHSGISHFTIMIYSTEEKMQRILNQLNCIIELLEVGISNKLPVAKLTS